MKRIASGDTPQAFQPPLLFTLQSTSSTPISSTPTLPSIAPIGEQSHEGDVSHKDKKLKSSHHITADQVESTTTTTTTTTTTHAAIAEAEAERTNDVHALLFVALDTLGTRNMQFDEVQGEVYLSEDYNPPISTIPDDVLGSLLFNDLNTSYEQVCKHWHKVAEQQYAPILSTVIHGLNPERLTLLENHIKNKYNYSLLTFSRIKSHLLFQDQWERLAALLKNPIELPASHSEEDLQAFLPDKDLQASHSEESMHFTSFEEDSQVFLTQEDNSTENLLLSSDADFHNTNADLKPHAPGLDIDFSIQKITENKTFAEVEQWITDFTLVKMWTCMILDSRIDTVIIEPIWQKAEKLFTAVNTYRQPLIHEEVNEFRKMLTENIVVDSIFANNLNLVEIPEELFNLKDLKRLDYSKNNIQWVPKAIENASTLTELKLSDNQLYDLPQEFAKLSTLKRCCLSFNKLKCIPTSILCLSELEVLRLAGNQIKILPDSIVKLSKLKELLLSGNLITQFPKSMASMNQLTVLSLENNDLKEVPCAVFTIPLLKKLNLSGNFLSSLPENISKAYHIRELNISNNNFTSLPGNIFDLYKLITLDISGNPLTSIPSELFSELTLKKLIISPEQKKLLPPYDKAMDIKICETTRGETF